MEMVTTPAVSSTTGALYEWLSFNCNELYTSPFRIRISYTTLFHFLLLLLRLLQRKKKVKMDGEDIDKKLDGNSFLEDSALRQEVQYESE